MTTLTLPADLGIESAASLKAMLTEHLAETGALDLDASQASRLHCASLQLLAAFVRSRQANDLPTGLQASPALAQGLGLLGLGFLLGDASQSPLPHALNQEKSS